MTLRSLFVDFDSYFASVEQEVQPALRGRPLAVVPVLAESTCCIAASYAAKALGIRTGTRVADARRLCPDLVLCLARPALYVEWHHRLLEAIGRVLPISSVGSIDEVDCALIGSERRRDRAQALARAIKAEIAREATFIRCSIGIAPNAFLAKTAADMRKPDGLTVIAMADLPAALHELQLRDLCGIGPALAQRLQRHGIHSVVQLTAADAATLRRVWGSVEGERFHALLHGGWLPPRPTARSSVGHSHVLGPELRNAAGARAVLCKLLSKAAMRLRRLGLTAGALSVRVRYTGEWPRWERGAHFAATASTQALLHELRALIEDPTVPALPGPRGARPLALSGMRLNGIRISAASCAMAALSAPKYTALWPKRALMRSMAASSRLLLAGVSNRSGGACAGSSSRCRVTLSVSGRAPRGPGSAGAAASSINARSSRSSACVEAVAAKCAPRSQRGRSPV